jgi:hypothetical protein
VDLYCFSPDDCYRSDYWFPKISNGLPTRQIDVSPILRLIWKKNLNLDITLIQHKGFAYQRTLYIHGFLAGSMDCGAAPLTEVLQSLIPGELGIRVYGRLASGVGINRDGSGGRIRWGTLESQHGGGALVYSTDEYDTAFFALDGGKHLKMVARPIAKTVLELSASLRDRVLEYTVLPPEGVVIDLETMTKFDCGLIYSNKELKEA